MVPTDVKTLYEQVDAQGPLARQSDELFMKELIPPLIFSLAFEVVIEEGITDIVAIRDELMIATQSGKILRYSWEGEEIRDYSLDLKRIPFCVDQQVMKAVPLSEKGAYVTHISYSPLLGGFAIILMNGKAAFLVASTSAFDPNVRWIETWCLSEWGNVLKSIHFFLISVGDGDLGTAGGRCHVFGIEPQIQIDCVRTPKVRIGISLDVNGSQKAVISLFNLARKPSFTRRMRWLADFACPTSWFSALAIILAVLDQLLVSDGRQMELWLPWHGNSVDLPFGPRLGPWLCAPCVGIMAQPSQTRSFKTHCAYHLL